MTNPTNGGLLNPKWPYVPAAKTDIRATFDRVRAEMKAVAEPQQRVTQLRVKKGGK